ncbi:MAG: PorV/PorQ family protein [Saprospiraceae bacterium]|nr:PorV/PorQ family protein [Saprospiraceae bacterium]
MNNKYTLLLAICSVLAFQSVEAGNPDRQGEAGANQLLINPWARSAGLHSLNTSMVTGTDAMYMNVAGLARIDRMQLSVGHTRYLEGADLSLNALSYAQRMGSGAFGISLVSFDLGDFITTTEDTPEGTGATFSPSYFNLGVSYAHVFSNKVSVGATAKFVNESISNVGARAFALDAGVQYVTGEKDNFKFGVSLRNVGSRMVYRGEGLSKALPNPGPTFVYPNTYYERGASYELPSQLNIGASYDFLLDRTNRVTVLGNFTSNAFSRDQVGVGAEYGMNKTFALRLGYKVEFDAQPGSTEATLDSGISAGFSASLPLRKGTNNRLSLDYAYRQTNVYQGIHNLGVRLDM